MPDIPPPPWIPSAPSSSCMRKPASVESSSQGAPGSSAKRDAFARQQLFAGAETIALCIGDVAHLLLKRAEFADQRQHLLAIGAKALGTGIDAALDDRHGNSVAHQGVRSGGLSGRDQFHVIRPVRQHKPDEAARNLLSGAFAARLAVLKLTRRPSAERQCEIIHGRREGKPFAPARLSPPFFL